MKAGDMIAAGDVGRVLWIWRREGGGARGWAAAEAYLAALHPDAAYQSRAAVLRIAQETADVGNRYRRGGPNYQPPQGTLPDVRRLLREAGIQGSGQGGFAPCIQNVWSIETRDVNAPGKVLSSFTVAENSSGILSRSLMDDAGRAWADQQASKISGSPGAPAFLRVSARILGSFVTYC